MVPNSYCSAIFILFSGGGHREAETYILPFFLGPISSRLPETYSVAGQRDRNPKKE